MQISSQLSTIRDFIRYAISRFQGANLFYGHGTDNAKDEAFYLIWQILKLPHSISAELLDAKLLEYEKTSILDLIERRVCARIPVAYLVNRAWFADLEFYVDFRVLIPRSPLAEIIQDQFQPWLDIVNINCILEIGTGSGCIAIACAKSLPQVMVDATDISADALEVAQLNVLQHDLAERIHLYEANLYPSTPKKYDVIISNPPYVTHDEIKLLPPEYLHEPSIALAAGVAGLDYAKDILLRAKHYLNPWGILIVEIGNSQAAMVAEFPNLPFIWLEFSEPGAGVFILYAKDLEILSTELL